MRVDCNLEDGEHNFFIIKEINICQLTPESCKLTGCQGRFFFFFLVCFFRFSFFFFFFF